MGKNIILCSDGTGNKGGHGADTNVFRLFNAVDIHNGTPVQITFYDDGVGTSKNKYWKALTGAFGIGFECNVLDLYEFLARNYDAKACDKIFLFGFSRGAATVRAFAGMVQKCGLLDVDNPACQRDEKFNEDNFQRQIVEARNAYRVVKFKPTQAQDFKRDKSVHDENGAPGGNIPIQMIGVWDTVSALGFPQNWRGEIDGLFRWLDKLSDLIWPHNYYNYQLNKNVLHVYHALAIDDERQTFFPRVWNETDKGQIIKVDRPVNIEQVWFAGVHSNIGGGYPRAGMSMVAYDWMMTRADKHGIRFIADAQRDVSAAANVNGRLYDSRSGPAIYYRYGPRDISLLCQKVSAPIRIHESVVERLSRGAARYAPRSIPYDVEIVPTDLKKPVISFKTAASKADWENNHANIWRWVAKRKKLYQFWVVATLALLIVALILWNVELEPNCRTELACAFPGVWGHVADILNYVLPDVLGGFVTLVTINYPEILIGIIVSIEALRRVRNKLRRSTHDASDVARLALLKQYAEAVGKGGPADHSQPSEVRLDH